jgi:hypothetical protein
MTLLNLTDSEKQSLQCAIACGAFILVVSTGCLCMLRTITVDTALFYGLSGLICTFAGIGTASFFKYRSSDYEAMRIKAEGDAKIAAATRPSAVSVTTPTTTVNTPTP